MQRSYPNLTGKTAAFTGHRPPKLGGYGIKVDEQLIALATFIMLKTNPAKVISGMALGWDMNVAHAAIRLKIPVTAAIPFVGQEKIWPDASKERYHAILEKCSEVIFVSPGSYASVKMELRNRWMVDKCDHLIGLYDGSSGGTQNCVMYAASQQRPMFNVWQEWQTLINGGKLQ
jgi:uncharacterized phage-like protein YoqJ